MMLWAALVVQFWVAHSQGRFLQESTVTSTLTTLTTTSDPCILAQDACQCAAGQVCGWSAFANGGGICQNRGRATEIDCHLCATQAKCATTSCPQLIDPCDCAAAAGCAWDLGFGMCLASSVQTSCQACPTQAGCNLDPPVLLPNGYNPSKGGSHSSGSDLVVVLQFDRVVNWCPGVGGDDATFWCSGSVNDQVIPRTYMGFSTTTLSISMEWYLSSITLETSRTCGIAIGLGRICDQENVAFQGLAKGEYSFQLLDTVGPTLIGFDPKSTSELVPLDGSVNLLWNEPVMLSSSGSRAELVRLEVDEFGITRVMESFSIPLQEPNAEIISSSLLRVHLNGLLSPNKLYTLALPAAAVTDLAGNGAAALSSGRFNFRAAPAAINGSTAVSTSSNAVGVVIVIVCVAVFCILAGGIGLIKLWRSHADAISNFLPKQKARSKAKSTQHFSPPAVERSEKSIPTFEAANAAAQNAYRAAAAAAERLREEDAGAKTSGAAGGAGGSWAQRPGSKGPSEKPKPSAKVHPERDGFNAGRARRSNPNAEGTAAGKAEGAKAPAPAADSNLPPEVKAVEKKLHDVMDEPIATRRKLFKELLVEFHPDKNSSSHAKEVFQYVNNARSWFLVES